MRGWGLPEVSDSLKEHRAAAWTIEHLLFTTGLQAALMGAPHRGLPTQPRFSEMNHITAYLSPSSQQCFLFMFVSSAEEPNSQTLRKQLLVPFFFFFGERLARKRGSAWGDNASQNKHEHNSEVVSLHPPSYLLALPVLLSSLGREIVQIMMQQILSDESFTRLKWCLELFGLTRWFLMIHRKCKIAAVKSSFRKLILWTSPDVGAQR